MYSLGSRTHIKIAHFVASRQRDVNKQCYKQCKHNFSTGVDRFATTCGLSEVAFYSFFLPGCSVKFDGKYAGNQIKTLDLAKLGDAKIYWREEVWTDVVKSFNIMNIAFYHGGSEVKNKFLRKKGNVNKKNGNWEMTLKVIFGPESKMCLL